MSSIKSPKILSRSLRLLLKISSKVPTKNPSQTLLQIFKSKSKIKIRKKRRSPHLPRAEAHLSPLLSLFLSPPRLPPPSSSLGPAAKSAQRLPALPSPLSLQTGPACQDASRPLPSSPPRSLPPGGHGAPALPPDDHASSPCRPHSARPRCDSISTPSHRHRESHHHLHCAAPGAAANATHARAGLSGRD